MKTTLLLSALLVLAGCSTPYTEALESPNLSRPDPYPTPADQRAEAPYENSPYFD